LLDNNGNISVKDGATTKFVDGSVEVDYANGLTTNIDGKLAVRGGTGISVTEMGGVSLNTSIFASGLEQNMNGQIVVDTDTIASKNYVDTNFVNVNDLPGQLDDYVPLTDKGAANGVATLDGSGQVPLNQLGNVPAAYITSVGTNLDVSAGQLTVASTPTFTAVDINSIAKQVATTATASMASVVNVLTWNKADYRSAKLLVKASTASHTQVSEIILSLDSSDNVAITEFGIVYTDGELGQVTADVSGTDVRVRVTTLYPSTDVSVVGTLLA
jgi:hypothetical protein